MKDVILVVVLSVALVVFSTSLGALASWITRESNPSLEALGVILSVCITSWIVMYLMLKSRN